MTVAWIGVGTAVLSAGAGIYGSNKQAKAAKNAAGLNMDQYQNNVRLQQPYMNSGGLALGQLNTLLGLGGAPRAGGMSQPPPQQQFMPTPGGGVQPIMANAPQQQPGMVQQPPQQGVGTMGANIGLRNILQLRASHGDTEAQRMLGMV